MKKIKTLAVAALILSLFAGCGKSQSEKTIYTDDTGISYAAVIDGASFSIYENGSFDKTFLKGVNVGAGKPGYFPGELGITKSDYLRWFGYIQGMNANVIRVYTTLMPAFYDALYEFNKTAETPLYLIQGVWVNEENMNTYNDGYNANIKNAFIDDSKDLTDIIHGNCVLPEKVGFASGEYTSDVSPYVIGWILGIEWFPDFIDGTNESPEGTKTYKGQYLQTDATPAFESLLAEIGDIVIGYETETYHTQRPVAFSNWVTTDTLTHDNEPLEQEDRAAFDPELIKSTDKFKAGLFASYHVYPYYPDFLNYQEEYVEYVDDSGNKNPYKAYLIDLKAHHDMPVLISEFGIPASRGMTHVNVITGFNQGFVDESTQGKMDASMLQDIYDTGCAGGIVFTWQDEWFKRTWNTMDYNMSDRRPFWNNVQTCEQMFGILAFDAGVDEGVCCVDGDIEEWKGVPVLFREGSLTMKALSDEQYLYLCVNKAEYNQVIDKIIIPIDTIQAQGNNQLKGTELRFEKATDFIICINGKDDSRVLTDAYYDAFYYSYGEILGMIPKVQDNSVKGSGVFNPVYLCLNKELCLPKSGQVVEFSKYETGVLTYGDANPSHSNYNSLTDVCVVGDNIEIRIPWALINFADPSTKSVIGDVYSNEGIEFTTVEGISLGASLVDKNDVTKPIAMPLYTWENWELPRYHERLKSSYYFLQEAFAQIG